MASEAQAGCLCEDDETAWRSVWDGPTDPPKFHIKPLDRAGKPFPHRSRDRLRRAEAVVARHEHDRAQARGWRDPERVALALDDEERHRDRIELRQPARSVRSARRPEWEREAEHAGGFSRRGGAAGDPRTRRPAAGEERQAVQGTGASCSTTEIQAASSWAAGAGERRPATR